ncbi:MAG: LysR family transcriptional regulator [Spirochaetaceae bacterium]|jgi:DNA-binding transcriptional LysR family regulator|nr:LysR family transcriptional regulator [Spirochaetaceae bacterium]
MNVLFFKYAIEIERTRSITKAAENLYMAQPNLSKAIKEMEDTIGFAIFERNSRGVVPTPKGFRFLSHARKILEEMEQIKKLTDAENPERQAFSISIPRGSYIAAGFTKFAMELDTEKEININIQETNSLRTMNNVIDSSFNLGIIRYQTIYENYYFDYLADKHLDHDQVWEFEYLALMSKKHPLAMDDEVPFSKLKSYIELLHGDTVVPYLNVAELRAPSQDAFPKKRIYLYERCNQFELLTSLPVTYMWVSPIPDKMLERYDLIQRKCAFLNNRYKDVLIYRKGYPFTVLDKKFIDKVFESRNEVSLKQYT